MGKKLFRLAKCDLVSLEGHKWPRGLTRLDLGENKIDSLEGIPPDLTKLFLGNNQLRTLKGIPPSVTVMNLGTNQITTLEGLPSGLLELHMGTNRIASWEGLPPCLNHLNLGWNKFPATWPDLPKSLEHSCAEYNAIDDHIYDQLLTIAYCGALCSISSGRRQVNSFELERTRLATGPALRYELTLAMRVPLNKRPARVVIVVLSSSSVPRVGKRAAVRRLNRADLVREMAGMLG